MSRIYRQGAVGALMDEYQRAGEELMELVAGLTDAEFEAARGGVARGEEFGSIREIVHHVVRAGYGYANYLRMAFSVEGSRAEVTLATRIETREQLAAMLAYTVATLEGRWEMTDEEIEAVRIRSRWGEVYDLEQMLEHAIVHVLRHRRQIERWLERTPSASG